MDYVSLCASYLDLVMSSNILGNVRVKSKMKVASDLCVNIEYRYYFIAFIVTACYIE